MLSSLLYQTQLERLHFYSTRRRDYIHTHTNAHKQKRVRAHTHTNVNARTHTHTHTHTNAHKRTRAHSHARTHTHTHIHTHAESVRSDISIDQYILSEITQRIRAPEQFAVHSNFFTGNLSCQIPPLICVKCCGGKKNCPC